MIWRSRATSASRRSRTRASGFTPVSASSLRALLGPMPKMYGRAYRIFFSRGRSTPAIRAIALPLPLPVLRIALADDAEHAPPFDHLAMLTDRLDARANLQCTHLQEKIAVESRIIDGAVSARKGPNYGSSHGPQDPPVRRRRIRRPGDGPADHQMGGAAAHRIGRAHGPDLVPGGFIRHPNP